MTSWSTPEANARLARRYASERRFKALGLAAILISLAFLAGLLVTMTANGIGGLTADFLSGSDSTDAASAGIWGALKGSLLTMAVTLACHSPPAFSQRFTLKNSPRAAAGSIGWK